MEKEGIVEKVQSSEWAAPIVAVPKKDGHIRLCGDYKVTVNPHLVVDQYPLPKPEDIFASLAGGKKFTKLDLSRAYQQMELEEDARSYVTVNTHQGLYRYLRLPFGIASAPALFQRTMDTILQGISGVHCYIDDILVTGPDETTHLQHYKKSCSGYVTMESLSRKASAIFFQESVEFLDHRIDALGLHTTSAKIEAIQLAPKPKDQAQLRSFLGLILYYGKFIPNLATMLQPLNSLLQVGKTWKWTAECERAFQQAKDSLVSAPVLAHYDPKLPVRLAGDASSYGMGAVIAHVYPDGTECPIAYTSRTFTASERNYAQLEKEAYSLVYGVKKFHQYLYGCTFTLCTDQATHYHFWTEERHSSLAAARLQRWALILSAYQYDILFRRTQDHCNADGLLRLPITDPESGEESVGLQGVTVFNIGQIQSLTVTASQLQNPTWRDPVLSQVLQYTQSGWPDHVPEELKPYENRRTELAVEGDCLLW